MQSAKHQGGLRLLGGFHALREQANNVMRKLDIHMPLAMDTNGHEFFKEKVAQEHDLFSLLR